MNLLAKVASDGSALTSWTPLFVLLGAFGAILVGLFVFGRSGDTTSKTARFLLRIPDGLERIVHIPGWAAATVGMALFGVFVAGQAFYNDVAWHVALGRDKNLFTAPHTGIVIGLGLILMSGAIGVLLASLQRVDTTLRWRAVRVPWSTLPLLALGGAAVTGFPLDELWHNAFGVDVTMWSPTHMLMILGAAFVGVAAWLVLADAGVKPHDNRWSMGVHVLAAWLTLLGLVAPLGEFSFGVPQFQQIFHPLILTIACCVHVRGGSARARSLVGHRNRAGQLGNFNEPAQRRRQGPDRHQGRRALHRVGDRGRDRRRRVRDRTSAALRDRFGPRRGHSRIRRGVLVEQLALVPAVELEPPARRADPGDGRGCRHRSSGHGVRSRRRSPGRGHTTPPRRAGLGGAHCLGMPRPADAAAHRTGHGRGDRRRAGRRLRRRRGAADSPGRRRRRPLVPSQFVARRRPGVGEHARDRSGALRHRTARARLGKLEVATATAPRRRVDDGADLSPGGP